MNGIAFDDFKTAAATSRGAALLKEMRSPYRKFKPRPDQSELFDEQTSFVGSTAKVSVCLGGTGCLGAEQPVYDAIYGGWRPVSEIKGPFVTLSIKDGEPCYAMASMPFIKGDAALYRIHLSNGRTFISTAEHRVMTTHGWQTVKDATKGGFGLCCGIGESQFPDFSYRAKADADCTPRGERQPRLPALRRGALAPSQHRTASRRDADLAAFPNLAESAAFRHRSNEGIYPSASRRDALRSSRKPEDSQGGCLTDHRSNGEPLQWREETCQASLQQQADALARTRQSLPTDGPVDAQASIHPCQRSGLLSNSGSSHPDNSRQVSFGIRASCTPSKPALGCDQAGQQFELPIADPLRTSDAYPRRANRSDSTYPCNSSLEEIVGGTAHITRMEYIRTDSFFDFTVHGTHCYVASGAVHHNSGKTIAAAMRVARRLRTQTPYRVQCPYWIIGETYEQVCGVCWVEKLSTLIPESLFYADPVWLNRNLKWPKVVQLKHPTIPGAIGWQIEFRSFEQGRAKMQAASIGGAWFNEQPPLELVDEVFGRTRDYNSPVDIDFTPLKATLDWPKRYRNPPKGWRFFHLNNELNMALAEGWAADFLASIPADYRETRRVGLFTSFKGAVFKDWRYDRHVVEPFEIPRDAFRCRGIDFGYTAPFVCARLARLPRTQTLPDGRKALEGTWVLYHEYVKPETLLIDHAAAIKNQEPWGGQSHMYGNTVADHDEQDATELRSHGVNSVPADKSPGSVKAGIYALQKLMLGGTSEVAPKFITFNTCETFIAEVGAYRYEPGTDNRNSLEIPVKKDDHVIDATRYAIVDGLRRWSEFPAEMEFGSALGQNDWRKGAKGFVG